MAFCRVRAGLRSMARPARLRAISRMAVSRLTAPSASCVTARDFVATT